jgi:hypothetical protein
MIHKFVLLLLVLSYLTGYSAPAFSAEKLTADLCVYGGTSGGVVAAVQGARMGKRVILVLPDKHLGGMTSGGLSAVDIGDPRSVGGITREYFTRLVAKYGQQLNWDKAFVSHGGPATGGAYSIEPHVAEQLFDEMVTEAGVIVWRDARLQSVMKSGPRIQELHLEDGRTITAKMFIDATYEGDLMVAAGVSFTIEREGNAKYGERFNGIQFTERFMPHSSYDQPGKNGRLKSGLGAWDRDWPLDPYVKKGDPQSGLLPLIQAGEPGVPGAPAPGVQAYCYRLCLTTDKNNMLPITPPADYDPAQYELVVRFIEACLANGDDMDLRWFSKHDPLPHDKWDFNTATFGGNLPGLSWAWPNASYREREQLALKLENYHRGLLHFLATDPRVPEKVRSDMQRFGLPKDEFKDHGGWPHQVYVREGRRMVSDLVLTEHHTYGHEVAPKSIGLGSYGTDTHEVRRIVKDGVVVREGKTASGRDGFGPYQIGYDAIVPKRSECENLLVTFALSASHTAFSSIRMEPVFMVTCQSAATAAVMAIDNQLPIQDVDYVKLREKLDQDGQIVEWKVPAKKQAVVKPVATVQVTSASQSQAVPVTPASHVAFSPLAPVQPTNSPLKPDTEAIYLAHDVKPELVNGKQYDLVIVGATASGIATAVRAARDGCTVLLVQHNRHMGGMLINGLSQWDALYGGPRAPLFSELLHNIEQHYIETYGRDSKDHQVMRCTHEHYPISWVESHVMERECNRLVAGEKNITLLYEHYPVEVTIAGRLIQSVKLTKYGTDNVISIQGSMFCDSTYEGDLLALAKVPYRCGREGRDEYQEPHAGKLFGNVIGKPPASVKEEGINIYPYKSRQAEIDLTSPFTADNAIQAYNFRFCVTKDPENRLPFPKPANYDRNEYVKYNRRYIAASAGPNMKSHVNSPILPGENHAYPEANWDEREKIIQRHLDFGLGLMWFLQNDPSISTAKREEYLQWGLPKDEFADNNHIPYEMYVREARRLVGRYLITELDGMKSPDYPRARIQPDSIAITDWYMDSHACTTDSRPDFHYDGKLILTEESRPAQIPYRSLLPKDLDNLLVPVCLSSTHIAWGAIRLEPVWMQTGEAAGVAAGLAKSQQTTPGELDAELLLQTLVKRRHLVTFLNELKVDADDPRVPAAQYFGTKGFFADYRARLDEPLTEAVQELWLEAAAQLKQKKLAAQGESDAHQLAQAIHAAEQKESAQTGEERGTFLLKLWQQISP